MQNIDARQNSSRMDRHPRGLFGSGDDLAGEAGFLEFVHDGFGVEVAGDGEAGGFGFCGVGGDAGNFGENVVDGVDAGTAAEVEAGDFEGGDFAVGGAGGGIDFDETVGGFTEVAAAAVRGHRRLFGAEASSGAVRTTVLAVVSQTALTPVTGATAVLTPVTHLAQQRWTSERVTLVSAAAAVRVRLPRTNRGARKRMAFMGGSFII